MLAVVGWDAGGDAALWSDRFNWSGDQLPTADDDAQIDAAFAAGPIVVQSTVSIKSLTSAAPLVIEGSFSVSTASVISNDLTFSGELAGAGDLTVEGELTWSAGNMYGPGKTIVAAGGSLNITGEVHKRLYRALDNAATAVYSGNNLSFGLLSGSFGVINNLAGGVFTVSGEGDFDRQGPGVFNNAGSFVKQGQGTTTSFLNSNGGVAFNNSGSINVQSGRLQLAGGSTSGAATIIGGVVEDVGTHTLHEGASITGAGQFAVMGSLNVVGDASVARLALSGSSNHVIAGAGDLTVQDELLWSGGLMVGAGKTIVAAGSNTNITGTAHKFLCRTLENAGAATYDGTNLSFGQFEGSVGVINNLAGGVFTVSGEGDFDRQGPGVFNNAGSFVKQGQGTTTSFLNSNGGVAFNNSGSINVQSGRLQLAGGSTSGAATIIGGVVEDVGTHTLHEGASITGAGQFAVMGSLNVVGDASVARLALSGSSNNVITGAGDLTVQEELTWSSGDMTGAGKTIVAAGGTLNITGEEHKRLLRTLDNAGTAVYDGINLSFGVFGESVGVINNLAGGDFTVIGEGDFVPLGSGTPAAFNNLGSFVKQGEGTTTSFFHSVTGGVPFHNNGSIAVQSGRLQLSGGSTSGAALIIGGVVEVGGTYTLNEGAAITGAGQVTVTGTLDVLGDASTARLALAGASTVITGAGDLTVQEELTWSSGDMAGSGKTIVAGRWNPEHHGH